LIGSKKYKAMSDGYRTAYELSSGGYANRLCGFEIN
jgi:hypothetical protein